MAESDELLVAGGAAVKIVDAEKLLSDLNVKPPEIDLETGAPRTAQEIIVSNDPKISVYPRFFSCEECDHLIKLSEGCWHPSFVGGKDGTEDSSSVVGGRTSWSCRLRWCQTSIVERLEHRIATVTGSSVAQVERLNMVRYAPGEHFSYHHDGKFRPKTVFVYLNDLCPEEEDGDTFFPVLGFSFKPRRGTAVVWRNVAEGETEEDSRMIHAGQAPKLCIKYGVNCFVNNTEMRELAPLNHAIPLERAAVQRISDLFPEPPTLGDNGQPTLQCAMVVRNPKMLALAKFLTASEVGNIMEQVGCKPVITSDGPFAKGTHTIHQFDLAATATVAAIESRCCTVAGQTLEYLARLRVVRPGTVEGFCDRGCGKYLIYVCLGESDEVFFPKLGIRFLFGPGDALLIPNANFDTGMIREEMRTLRVHRHEDCVDGAIGLECVFHDDPVRSLQSVRKFVPDSDFGAQ